jgi:2-polyprenyl-3-methyl-5-hydroxy-6-metoxy-1,4-benzoquinol methylase
MAVPGFRWRRCGSCRSLFVEDPPTDRRLASLYTGEDYFARDRLGPPGAVLGYSDYLADREHIEAKFDAVLRRLERHGAGGELLDVGAGTGFMLAAGARRGWRGTGIEPNPWAVQYAREKVGVEVRAGTFGAVPVEGRRYGAVTMMDLIEHLPRPDDAVAEAARITRPGGHLAILTPHARSLLGRALGRRWPEVLRAPGHLVLFSAAGLARLLRRHGYEVLGAHSVGKTTSAGTLVADASPTAPKVARLIRPLAERWPLAARTVTVDPRTKLCLYARLVR